MLKQHGTYRFEAKLKSIGEDTYYFVTFQVLSDNKYNARAKLWEYLNHPEQTGYRYEECVGLTNKSCDWVLIEEKEDES